MPITKNAIRCSNCRKLLGEGVLRDGRISIKCKCGMVNTIEVTPEKKPTEEKFVYNAPYQNRIPGIVRKEDK